MKWVLNINEWRKNIWNYKDDINLYKWEINRAPKQHTYEMERNMRVKKGILYLV